VDSAQVIRRARLRAGLTLRALAERAGTSHSTLAAYEAGRTIPRVDTLARILRAAGFAGDIELSSRADGVHGRGTKAHELAQALDLADRFPAAHRPDLAYPVFGRPA
jgi:transcriptional regulator with XRE-family HTH domain